LFDIDGGSKDILEIYNLYGWVWGSHWEMRWKTCKMFLSGKEGNEKKKLLLLLWTKKWTFSPRTEQWGEESCYHSTEPKTPATEAEVILTHHTK